MSRKDELYHYGVKGMKWGKRKAIREYLDAKKKGALDRSAKANALKRQAEKIASDQQRAREGRMGADKNELQRRWQERISKRELQLKNAPYRLDENGRKIRSSDYPAADASGRISDDVWNLYNHQMHEYDRRRRRNNSFTGKQETRRNLERSRNSAPAKKHEINVPKALRPGINRFLDSLPTEKNSVDYNKKQSKIAFNTANRIFDKGDAKRERGIPATEERETGGKYLATAYYYAGRASKKEGSRQEKVYQAIKGTRSKAKSFINKLRKKKR